MSTLGPAITASTPISGIKELVDLENKRPKEEWLQLQRVLPPEVPRDPITTDWVATCQFTSLTTNKNYKELARNAKKKDAQQEAARLVIEKYNRDCKKIFSPNWVLITSQSPRNLTPTLNDSLSRLSVSTSNTNSSPSRSISNISTPSIPPNTRTPPTLVASLPRRADNDTGTIATLVAHKIFYYPTHKLVEGGFGTVFKGYFEALTCSAAVKRIAAGSQSRMVAGEVEIFRTLSHPNIVRYFAYEQKDNFTFIAMELASWSLDECIKNRKYESFQQLQVYMLHAAQGLSYLHNNTRKKVIHRDISPCNILIFMPDNIAKITDFGISRSVESATVGGHTISLAGKTGWMSPESVLPNKQGNYVYTCQSDIYSLGMVILHTMSPGHCHPTVEQLNTDLEGSDYRFSLQNLLSAMLSRDPASRPRIEKVLEHPFFWNGSRFMSFINLSSNQLKRLTKQLRLNIDADYESFSCRELGGHVNWKVRLDPEIKEVLIDSSDHSKIYDGTSLIFLMEFVRDKDQHSGEEKRKPLPKLLGDSISSYGAYFNKCFPDLGTFLYTHLQKYAAQLSKLREEFYKSVESPGFNEL